MTSVPQSEGQSNGTIHRRLVIAKMSFQVLQERLAALIETTRQVQELISRLANLKFQPGSIPLDNEEGDVSAELSTEIHQTLKEQDEDLELLQQEVHDFPAGRSGTQREKDKASLVEMATRIEKDLNKYIEPFPPGKVGANMDSPVLQVPRSFS